MKSRAAQRKSSRDRATLRATPVSPVRTCTACEARPPEEQCVDIVLILAVIIFGFVAAYKLFHYILFLLFTHPRAPRKICHALNEFEQQQLRRWTTHTA